MLYYTSCTDIVGYTHSDGYCLCPEHAKYGRMKDTGNETGKVYPIFACDETDNDLTCDVCNETILEANI
jgi:hypothetical protein